MCLAYLWTIILEYPENFLAIRLLAELHIFIWREGPDEGDWKELLGRVPWATARATAAEASVLTCLDTREVVALVVIFEFICVVVSIWRDLWGYNLKDWNLSKSYSWERTLRWDLGINEHGIFWAREVDWVCICLVSEDTSLVSSPFF